MITKFEQAKLLVSQGKHKKALLVLKKINPKIEPVNFESIELEVVCLFNLKNYQMANIKGEAAFNYADSSEKKLSILLNLASINEQLQLPEKALYYLQLILAIDAGVNTAPQRMSLIQLAFTQKQYDLVEKFGLQLVNISEHFLNALMLLSKSAINVDDTSQALKYLNRIVAEMHTNKTLELSPQHLVEILNNFHKIQAYEKEQSLLSSIKTKYNNEAWFIEITNRLQHLNRPDGSHLAKQKVIVPNFVMNNICSKSAIQPIIGNTTATVNIISKLKKALEQMGATFSPHMQIVEVDGDITVKNMKANDSLETLMNVPIRCMPLVNDYKYEVDDKGMLLVWPKKSMANPHALQIMRLLVQMYNACNKLANWKLSYPLFALKGSENLVDALLQARCNGPHYKAIYDSENIKDGVNKLIYSFTKSRVFSFTNKSLRQVGIKIKEVNTMAFIPFIELANHKMGAPGFDIDPQGNSLLLYSEAGNAGREVFVQYNLDDPLITFLMYGFVDKSAQWVYTIPMLLKTSQGKTINVSNDVAVISASEIPEDLIPLTHYLPARLSRKQNSIDVSKLIIPGKDKNHSLQEVLAYILKNTDFEGFYSHPDLITQEVEILEKQILNINKEYWSEIQITVQLHLSQMPGLEFMLASQLNDLCEFYILHISRYINRSGTALNA